MGLAPMPIPCLYSTIASSLAPTQPRATRNRLRSCCHRRGHSSPEPRGTCHADTSSVIAVVVLAGMAPAVPLFVARAARRPPPIGTVVSWSSSSSTAATMPSTPLCRMPTPTYAKLRPTLKIQKRDLVRLSDTLGLHPSLKPLEKLLQGGQLAVIPGVGYPR